MTYTPGGQLESVQLTRIDSDTRQVEAIENIGYGYDAAGLRTVRIAESDSNEDEVFDAFTTQTFLFDSSSPTGYAEVLRHEVTDTTNGASISSTHFTLGSSIHAQATAGESTETFVGDPSMHVRSVMGEDGRIGYLTPVHSFDAFGVRLDTATPVSPIGYRGQWTDAATGEQFLRARWYNPTAGRFSASDPSSPYYSAGDSNQFLYASANPIGNYDPTGLFSLGSLSAGTSISGALNSLSTSAANVFRGAVTDGAVSATIANYLGDDPMTAFVEGFQESIRDSFLEAIPVFGTIYSAYQMVQTGQALYTLLDVLLIQRYLDSDEIENAVAAEQAQINAAAGGGGFDPAHLIGATGFAAIAALGVVAVNNPKAVQDILATRSFRDLINKAKIRNQSVETENLISQRSCGANSFTGNTHVLLADGSTKPISEIEVGELVLAHDPVTGQTVAEEVLNVIYGYGHKELVELTLADGSTLVATDEHPFWDVEESRWFDAEDLVIGDVLLSQDGTTITVNSIRPYLSPDQAAYNLTVDSVHTYFVVPGEAGVLVHNTVCPTKHVARTTKQNADILRRNLAREGRQVPPGHAAGHIVASGGQQKQWAAAARSRQLLERYGIDINDAANGIPIPTPTPHNLMHNGPFHDAVEKKLRNTIACDHAGKRKRPSSDTGAVAK